MTLPPGANNNINNNTNTNKSSLTPTGTTKTGGYYHTRKHSQTAPGSFEAVLPSTSASNLPHIATMAATSPPPPREQLSASHIAAQAAVMHHQNRDQTSHQLQLPSQQQHSNRQRSQTAPAQPVDDAPPLPQNHHKRTSGGPLSPPMLSLTEASAPRDTGFSGGYHYTSAAQTAANMVFPRVAASQPPAPQIQMPPPPPPPPPMPIRVDKPKVKLFSRPGKIYTKGESKEKPQPSPNKIGTALSNLQRGNFSTTSLESSAASFYSLGNASAATIRATDTPSEEKNKEKRHYFLSRPKHKAKDNEEYNLPLSSAKSNSRPTDPSAPSSLYNFNIPASPASGSTSFKSMSGLDLRHGGRALREKRKEEESSLGPSEWSGPGSVGNSAQQSSLYLHEPVDSGKLGLNSIALDDAWPYLKAKLLVVFEGEDLRLPIEDLNRVVTMHIQYTVNKGQPSIIIDDVRDLLGTGFAYLDTALRRTPEEKLIPALVELWVFTFTIILPYMQAVFLPLDLEFSGVGSMTAERARDFWGGVRARSGSQSQAEIVPISSVLDVRRMVLSSFRDSVILPRYDTLKAMFSRLSLEFLPQSLASMALASPMPIPKQQESGMSGNSMFSSASSLYLGTSPDGSYGARPGTAMSLDPSMASYNSTGSTLLGDMSSVAGGSSVSRSRAISNVSHSSADGLLRPFTPSRAGSSSNTNNNNNNTTQEQNVENSKQVTEMVGRMLQCMSVLSGVDGVGGGGGHGGDDHDEDSRVAELCRLLKLNWLGRGRTGRNRRGLVGGRVRRGPGDLSAAVGGGGGLFGTGTVREELSVP